MSIKQPTYDEGIETPKFQIIPFSNEYQDKTAQFITSILEAEFGYGNIDRPDLRNISNAYQRDPQSNFWLVVENGEVMGTIAIMNYGNGRGFLKRMYVKKELRSKGVGQKLLDTLLEFARNSEYQIIFTSTVEEFTSARQFYGKNGFEQIPQLPSDLAAPGDNIFLKLGL